MDVKKVLVACCLFQAVFAIVTQEDFGHHIQALKDSAFRTFDENSNDPLPKFDNPVIQNSADSTGFTVVSESKNIFAKMLQNFETTEIPGKDVHFYCC